MPRAVKTRVDNITAYLTPALSILDELNDAFGLSYVQPIIKTTQALIVGVQLHLRSETLRTGPLAVFKAIGQFTETLHKIYMFIQIQQDGNKIKQFLHQAQANKLLKDCQAGLDQAMEVFKGQTGVTVLSDVLQVQAEADNMRKELLELISTLSDTEGTISDRSSFVPYEMLNSSQRSSNSFSLLPSSPKPEETYKGIRTHTRHIRTGRVGRRYPAIYEFLSGLQGLPGQFKDSRNTHAENRTSK
ncbi:hypothetical protein C8R46DRAFT_1192123 [Mycena filopes]|nr:hypothetical protein C8R46DRAFT_1192123 [Mycena filopes]